MVYSVNYIYHKSFS